MFSDDEVVFRIDINGEIAVAAEENTFTYDLTAVTEIPSMATGTPNQIRHIIIKPNGYDYTWDSGFTWTLNNPEQPSATSVNTKQLYSFMYIAGIGDVCINQSLDIPV